MNSHRTLSVETLLNPTLNSTNMTGFNALLKAKTKLQDELFKAQRDVSFFTLFKGLLLQIGDSAKLVLVYLKLKTFIILNCN